MILQLICIEEQKIWSSSHKELTILYTVPTELKEDCDKDKNERSLSIEEYNVRMEINPSKMTFLNGNDPNSQ